MRHVVNIGDICTTTQGVQITKLNTSDKPYVGGYRYLYIADFISDKSLSFVNDDFEAKKVTENDLVMANTGSPGRVFKGKDGILSNNLFKISFDLTKVDRDYLFLMLSSNIFQYLLQQQMKGGIQKHLGHKTIARQEIPLPPLAEQQKIAAILDAADTLRQKDQQLIDHYTTLSQSLFLEMFGDPVTNPMGWEKRSLQCMVKSVIDCPHTTPRWTESGKVAIRTSNLTRGGWLWDDKRFVSEQEFHERSKRGYVKSGDIVLSREGTIGIAAIVTSDMEICLGQRLVQLIPDFVLANNYYLLYLLLYELEPERISRVMVGATSKHLNVKELRNMSLPSPPITLQNQFAERIKAIEAQKQQAQASLEHSEALFNSLLQRAFSGELTNG